MRFRSLLLAAGLSALLAGCGSENAALIPQDDADHALRASSPRPATRRPPANATAARRAVREAEQQLSGLPRKTDKQLKANLRDWLDHLDGRSPTTARRRSRETPTPTPTAEPTETPTPDRRRPDPRADRDADPDADAATPDADRGPGHRRREARRRNQPGTGGVPPEDG